MNLRRLLGASVLTALALAVVAVNCALPSVKPEVPQATPVLATLIPAPSPDWLPSPTITPREMGDVLPKKTRVPSATPTATPGPTVEPTPTIERSPVQRG